MGKCEYCNDTGWYGDNGPGIIHNGEYHPCDQCDKGRNIAGENEAPWQVVRRLQDELAAATEQAEKAEHERRIEWNRADEAEAQLVIADERWKKAEAQLAAVAAIKDRLFCAAERGAPDGELTAIWGELDNALAGVEVLGVMKNWKFSLRSGVCHDSGCGRELVDAECIILRTPDTASAETEETP